MFEEECPVKKKLLSVCFVLAAALSLMTVTASAAAPTEVTAAEAVARVERSETEPMYYGTLEDAVTAANQKGDVVHLMKTIDTEIGITLDVQAEITLNLGSNQINLKPSKTTSKKMSTLTITTTTTSTSGGAVAVTIIGDSGNMIEQKLEADATDPAVEVSGGVKVTIEGAAIKGYYGIKVSDGDLTVKSGTVDANASGIVVENGSLTVTGGTIKGVNGIEFKSGGSLTVEGGTIQTSVNVKDTGVGIAVSGTPAGVAISGGNISGPVALDLSKCKSSNNVTIRGGIFESTVADGKSVDFGENSALGTFISGGTFIKRGGGKDPLPQKHLADSVVQDDKGVVSPVFPTDAMIIFYTGVPDGGLKGKFADEVEDSMRVRIEYDAVKDCYTLPRLSNDPTYEKGAYTFAGWYTKNKTKVEYGDSITPDKIFSEDGKTLRLLKLEVYAHWGHTIKFNVNGGNFENAPDWKWDDAGNTAMMTEGKKLPDGKWPNNPTHKDYEFAGWYIEKGPDEEDIRVDTSDKRENYEFNNDTTLTAHWIKKVTFDLNYPVADGKDKKHAEKTTGHDGTLVEWPADPTRDDYTFAGWYTADTGGTRVDIVDKNGKAHVFESNTTLYAHWGYKIVFDAGTGAGWPRVEGGTDMDQQKDVITNEDGSVKAGEWPKDPIRNGYKFDGWYIVKEGGDTGSTQVDVKEGTPFEKNETVVYARWKAIYTITFDAKGGTLPEGIKNTMEVLEGSLASEYTLPTPTRKGYDFLGWFEQGTNTKIGEEYKFTNPITADARWGLSITFDAKGGTIYDKDGKLVGNLLLEVTADESGKLDGLPSAKSPDKHFDGWYIDIETEVTKDFEFKEEHLGPGDTINVYAEWSGAGPVTLKGTEALEVGKDKEITLTITSGEARFKDTVAPANFKVSYRNEDGTTSTITVRDVAPVGDADDQDASTKAVKITLSSAPDKLGTLTIKVLDGAFTKHVSEEPTVEITAAYKITFDPGTGKFETGESTDNPTLFTDASGILSPEKLKTLPKLKSPKEATSNPTDFTTLAGWYEGTQKIDDFSTKTFLSSVTLTAKWGYTVTFDPLDPNGKDRCEDMVIEGDQLEEADWKKWKELTYDDYTLAGWFIGSRCAINGMLKGPIDPLDPKFDGETGETELNELNSPYTLTGDITVHAHWVKAYKITFDLNYKGAPKIDPVKTNKLGLIDTGDWPGTDLKQRVGYTFEGWYTESIPDGKLGEAKNPTKVDENEQKPFDRSIILYAYWEPVGGEHTIIFDLNGGKFGSATAKQERTTNPDGTLDVGEWPQVTHPDGCEFAGWYDEEGDFVTLEPDGDHYFPKNTTLTARWKYVITFDANGGTVSPDSAATDANGNLASLPTPTREGYTFLGWYTAKEGGDKVEAEDAEGNKYEFKTNTVLYAQWDIVVTLTIDPKEILGDGKEVQLTLKASGAKFIAKVLPTMLDMSGDGDVAAGVTITKVDYSDPDDDYTRIITLSAKIPGKLTITIDPSAFLKDTRPEIPPSVEITVKEARERLITFKSNGFEADEEGVFVEDGTEKTEYTQKTDMEGKLPSGFLSELERKLKPLDERFEFDGWYMIVNEAEEGAEKTKEVPVTAATVFEDDATVYARWTRTYSYEIKVVPPEYGTVDVEGGKVEGDKTTAKVGATITLTVKPAEGYALSALTVEDSEGNKITVEKGEKENTFTFTMPAAKVTVTATFEKAYTITIPATTGGTVTAKPSPAIAGSTVTLTVTPNEGYALDTLTVTSADTTKVDTEKVSDTVYTFVMPAANVTVTAAFKSTTEAPVEETYTITVETSTNGTVKADKTTAKANETVTLTVTPNKGYELDKLTVTDADGKAVEVTNNAFKMPASNVKVTATFKEAGQGGPGGEDPGPDDPGPDDPGPGETKDSYTITINETRHGSISSTHTSAAPGTTVTLTVVAETDYEVDYVRINLEDGSRRWPTQNGRRYSFTMPASDVTVSASFSLMAAYNNFIPPQTAPQSQGQTQGQAFAPASLPTSVFKPLTSRPAAAMWDVPASSWAYPAAQWAYRNGYLDTAADGSFQLDSTVPNIQLWKIMARWQGETALDDSSVTLWARKSGAARVGTASGAMTRQNIVEYLYQCYFLMGGNVSVTGNLTQYHDNQLVTSPATKNAWIWAVNKGIISGTPDGYLNPNKTLTRGEFASILMRLCQNG